ncbi:MAG: tetratricopeptide repeat protein [Vicinamibacterales bacterium]
MAPARRRSGGAGGPRRAGGPAAQAAPGAPADPLSEAYFLFLRGQSLEEQGDVPGAIASLTRATELAPKAAEIRAELAGLYARQGRATDAVREGEKALDLDADNYEAHRILGFVQAALADRLPQNGSMIDQAIGHFEKALATGTRDPGMEITLGRLYVRAEKYIPAIRTLRNFLLLQPGYREGLVLLAQAYTGNGEPGEAVPVLEELVAGTPDDPRNRAWLAELYEDTGEWDKSAAQWAQITALAPGTATYAVRYATALINSGDLAKSRDVLQKLTADQPKEVMGWYLLSEVERRTGHPDAAADAARRILAIDATDARGLLSLAQAQTAAHDFAGVVNTLEARVSAPRDGDDDNGLHARLAVELAAAYQGLGERDKAVGVLEAALARTPNDGDLLFDLGAPTSAPGSTAAETAFRRVIEADPSHADALN